MADYIIAYKRSMNIEGGWADDKDDTGGQTWCGISRNNFPHWEGWELIDQIRLHNPTDFESALRNNLDLAKMVLAFYKTNFWDVMKLDQVKNQDIANEMFDTGLNIGWEKEVEFLQMALNATNRNGKDYPDIDEDGKIGPQTISVLNNHPRPAQVLLLLNCQQGVYYMNITRKKPSQEKFMTSWLSRVTI